jgi:hypothetical protein
MSKAKGRVTTRGWLTLALTLAGAGCGDGDDPGHDASNGDASLDGQVGDGASSPHDGALPGDAAVPVEASIPSDAEMQDAAMLPDGALATPPTAAFVLSDTAGSGTLWVRATSGATQGSAPIAETLYDWGDGAGLVATSTHRFSQPGTFTVRQQVRDALGSTASDSKTVTVSAFKPVRFSSTDLAPNMRVSPDGSLVENRSSEDSTVTGVVRSDASIAPGSGVFYFEGELVAKVAVGGFGLATAAAPLDQGSGGNAESLGNEAYGPLRSTGSSCTGSDKLDSAQKIVGYVIDYRASSPTVHYIQHGADNAAAVIASCTMAVTAPLFASYWSERATVGYEGRFNAGNDTVNRPFEFPLDALRSALTSAGKPDVAAALVAGFGQTRAARVDMPPTLEPQADVSVPVGQPVTLVAHAQDPEDGSLDAAIQWADTSSLWHARVTGVGASFTFTPAEIGVHPIELSVTDLDGVSVTKTVNVTVTGALEQPNPVQLVADATTGAGVMISADGLSASFTQNGKFGVKANQGIYGAFWYFEVHRIAPIRNMGNGLIVHEGSLNPYRFDNVPWSVSLNVSAGIWHELIIYENYTPVATDADYGWAVDYRSDHPKVYLIVHGQKLADFDLTEVKTPLYPMIYGNPTDGPFSADMSVNFTGPFAYDAKTILAAAGIDVSAMKLGWGVHAH